MRRLLRSRHFSFPLLSALILLGLALRLVRLDFQPLWWDEGYSVWFSGHPLLEMARLTAADIHPPLYYALLRGWGLLLGFGPVILRLFSILVSLAIIPLAYLWGRDLDDAASGWIAAAMVAINPIAIYYSQEIRMYGLAATFSMAALWAGWRFAHAPDARRRQVWVYGLIYVTALLGGLYTLYYFALIPLAQTVWALVLRRRLRRWLLALATASLLYLPWLLYAGPKLLNYVAYKVVKDNDTPLSILPYLGRHLSAFLVGHLEGRLAPFWPWSLLLFLPLILALALRGPSNAPADASAGRDERNPLLYLLLCLLLPLAIGFIQQLRAPFLPERFERVLLVAAPPLWLLLALAFRRLARESLPAALLTALLLGATTSASLWAFYTTPRYEGRDYRPLIATIQHNARAGDSIFAIFPWQVGYLWSYLPPDERPAIVTSPDESWGPAVRQTLDTLMSQGAVWFPEHLALGGILESQVERYLDQQSYQLLNRWYGEETRLTGWSLAPAASATSTDLVAPITWQNGVTLSSASSTEQTTGDGGQRLFLDLSWEGAQPINPGDIIFSLWLSGPQGFRWAQRDIAPFAQPWPALTSDLSPNWANQDRVALTIPTGVPPGEYDLWAAMLDSTLSPIPIAGSVPAPYAWLGAIEIPAVTMAPPLSTLAIAQPQYMAGEAIDFLGGSRSLDEQLPGDDLLVHLFWLPNNPLAPDHLVFLQLLDSQGQVAAGMEAPPIAWHPTSLWTPGIPLQSQHLLRIPAALAPGEYTLITGLFEPNTGRRQRWGKSDYIELGPVLVGARPHDYTPPTPEHPLNVALVGGHRLVGYDLVAGASPGSPVNLVLYWAPAGPTAKRLSSFVHLLDEDDNILAQSDSEPAAGQHPTTSWLEGEYIADAHTLTVPPEAGGGPYHLTVGLYDPTTGERLPFLNEAGDIVADRLVLPIP